MSYMNERQNIGASTVYTMLDNYCGGKAVNPLGVSSVAPAFAPYGNNPMMQDKPVFMGADYSQPPYMSNLMFCGSCGGNYCQANQAYHWPVDKMGNPLPDAVYNKDGKRVSGYESVAYVKASPSTFVNTTCAAFGAGGPGTSNCANGFNPKASVAGTRQ